MTEEQNPYKEIEEECKNLWEKENVYKFNEKSRKKIYAVDTPPPTVSGSMHIGHACSYSQQDFIIRYKRMKGYEIFYPFGTDDNGLPTERLIEKTKNIKSKDFQRSDFIKICMDFLKQELPKFVQDWKNIGISCDWTKTYSTIDKNSRRISQWSFLDLYKKGRIYRKDAPAMWCPECRTCIAQVEVQDKEMDSYFNDILFESDGEKIKIATTRPELLPACVAIFYHPDDQRYKKYKGKRAKVPLFNFEVPIMEDKRVSQDKGTGIVMCCTFGDQTDMEWQKAYNLPIKIAITNDGKMTEIAGRYKNLSLKDARKKIIEDLKQNNLLVSQNPIKHFVNVHERCGTPIEFVKSEQWFVKYLDLKLDLIKWGRELKWHPEFMKHRYENWVNGLQWDWLISNQRYFGVSFPVWYCKKCGNPIFADEKQLPVDPLKDKPLIKECPKCKCKEFIPETDILNTWFTSSMSPLLATASIKDEEIRKKLFPMNLRPQAHDIISFWLFNTLLKSRLHFEKNPWKDVAISGFVTLKGEKMAKSKGNIVSPQEVMAKYGSDAIRYWAASSKLGEDFDYQEKDIITGKKFVNKIINASKFTFMNLQDYKNQKPKKLEELDKLFLERLNQTIKTVTKNFEEYEYSKAKSEIDNFFWRDFCDNYLEIVKKRVYQGKGEEKISAQYTLYTVLFNLIKLFAPFTPFVTEKIYQDYFKKNEKEKSIHLCSWPESESNKKKNKKDEEDKWELFLELIKNIRQEKSNSKKPMNSEIKLSISKEQYELFNELIEDLKSVSNAVEIKKGIFKVEFI